MKKLILILLLLLSIKAQTDSTLIYTVPEINEAIAFARAKSDYVVFFGQQVNPSDNPYKVVDGRSWSSAFKWFKQAIIKAQALYTLTGKPIAIINLDSYYVNSDTTFTLPAYVSLYSPLIAFTGVTANTTQSYKVDRTTLSGGTTWGAIAGTLSNQTDLQSALNGKANTSHTQAISTITSLQDSLNVKAKLSHTHSISNINNLQDSLNTKQKTLVSGTNIKTINNTSLLGSGNITISGGGSGTGENNIGANVGDGQGVYKTKVDTTLQFKSLKSTGYISLTNNTNDITINSTTALQDTINARLMKKDSVSTKGYATQFDISSKVNKADSTGSTGYATQYDLTQISGGGESGINRLTSNFSSTSTSYVDVTGLSFTAKANKKYKIHIAGRAYGDTSVDLIISGIASGRTTSINGRISSGADESTINLNRFRATSGGIGDILIMSNAAGWNYFEFDGVVISDSSDFVVKIQGRCTGTQFLVQAGAYIIYQEVQ
jgi:hypothetical protein